MLAQLSSVCIASVKTIAIGYAFLIVSSLTPVELAPKSLYRTLSTYCNRTPYAVCKWHWPACVCGCVWVCGCVLAFWSTILTNWNAAQPTTSINLVKAFSHIACLNTSVCSSAAQWAEYTSFCTKCQLKHQFWYQFLSSWVSYFFSLYISQSPSLSIFRSLSFCLSHFQSSSPVVPQFLSLLGPLSLRLSVLLFQSLILPEPQFAILCSCPNFNVSPTVLCPSLQLWVHGCSFFILGK